MQTEVELEVMWVPNVRAQYCRHCGLNPGQSILCCMSYLHHSASFLNFSSHAMEYKGKKRDKEQACIYI